MIISILNVIKEVVRPIPSCHIPMPYGNPLVLCLRGKIYLDVCTAHLSICTYCTYSTYTHLSVSVFSHLMRAKIKPPDGPCKLLSRKIESRARWGHGLLFIYRYTTVNWYEYSTSKQLAIRKRECRYRVFKREDTSTRTSTHGISVCTVRYCNYFS